ncbi:hypothetical protein ACIBL6_15730 [Streptomyces sp. NPDC050400]|uniref:hypothetical protein n=1 Tax=Streptomyces sp. NPDC050400 TaxID=3365610 RepID=UPI00378AC952
MSPTRFASEHKWLYIGVIVVLVALAVVGVIRYESVKKTNDATAKANQLADAAEAAGYPRPSTDAIVRALGTDGGAVCDDPASALETALWKINMSNGATGPGQRPVIADTKAVRAEEKVLEIYCPDQLDDFRDKVDELKTEHTVRR